MSDKNSLLQLERVTLPDGMTLEMLNDCCDILADWEENSNMSYFPLVLKLYGVLRKGKSNIE